MENEEYDVFISYSRKDYVDENKNVIPGNIVSQVKQTLDENKISYWMDEKGIYSGDEFAKVIARCIRRCKVFLFISSENSNQSEWTTDEIATARTYKKKIIPFKIDESFYNENVIIFIAKLDYIDYYANQKQAFPKLVNAVKKTLQGIEDEKKRKEAEEERKRKEEAKRKEEERLRREEEERRQKEVQRKTISDIRLSCMKLNNEEAKIEIDRNDLLMKLDLVDAQAEREALREFILTSSPFQKRLNEITDRITELEESVSKANEELEQKKRELTVASLKLQKYDEARHELEYVLSKLKKAEVSISNLTEKNVNLTDHIKELKDELGYIKKQLHEKEDELAAAKNRVHNLETQCTTSSSVQQSSTRHTTPNTVNFIMSYDDPMDSKIEVFAESFNYGYRNGFRIKGSHKIISPAMWVSAYSFHEGLACVEDPTGNWGYINTRGSVCIPCKWRKASSFSEGLAAVMDSSGRWGYINHSGIIVIACKWDDAGAFKNGYARVRDHKGYRTINMAGTEVNT